MGEKVWFITGSSRGLGRHWVEAALERGDKVAATARNVDDLRDLSDRFGSAVLPLPLDVTDRDAVAKSLSDARAHFGRLDVVVNNAGIALFGAIEETSEEQARAQFEANLFGSLWVMQAAAPILREQGHGHIIQVSSVLGVIAWPYLGLYNASKWAVEGLAETLAQELAEFGVSVTVVEPTLFGTDWMGGASQTAPIDAYSSSKQAFFGSVPPVADPKATRSAILAVADADTPPARVFFGGQPVEVVADAYQRRVAGWQEWAEVSRSASAPQA